MRNMYYVDMHCHPSIKPYSWYITNSENPWDCRNVNTSLWYNDPPNGRDKKINKSIGLTKFTQSDFRTLTKGDVRIASACLSSIERGLFTPRGPFKKFGFRLLNFGLEVNPEFIRRVRRRNRDYFEELKGEYEYFLSEQDKQHNRTFPTHFKLTSDFGDIDTHLDNVDKDIIYIFFSIEGCHVFNNGGLESKLEDEEEVKRRIREVKGWDYRPLYVSIAHHINNDLCGHAKSLPPILERFVDQTDGMGDGFSIMGKVVLHELLDNSNDDRIYIDIKHMSAQSREEYYNILDDDYLNDPIPVLASHGAVNGRKSLEERGEEEVIIEDNLKFNNEDINFFDDEIIRIAKTGGFLGIQLDERRLISPELQKIEKKKDRIRGEQLFYQAGLVWEQIRYIAELLHENGELGWGTATIGSDYDGAVDPPNGYWTSDDFGILEENLIHHADIYLKSTTSPPPIRYENNNPIKPQAQEVIDLFMRGNAMRFLEQFLHR